MNLQFLQVLVLLGSSCLSQVGYSQALVYTQLTNGLAFPEFEAGATVFRMDDINHDGHVDILTMGDHGSAITAMHGICIWFGDGAGNFTNYMHGNFGYGGLAVGDVNNDGYNDVGFGIHHNYSPSGLGSKILEVALGDGTGMNWTAWSNGLAGNGETYGMFGTDFGDIDNDEDLDLVSISFGSGQGLHVYRNNMDGSWVQSFGFLSNANSGQLIQFGDFNNDGFLDFASTLEEGTAYFGDGTGSFMLNDANLPLGLGGLNYRYGISLGDINNNGGKEIAFINATGGVEVWGWMPDPPGWVNYSGSLPSSGNYRFTGLADMDADGLEDVIAFEGQTVRIWLGDGTGNWTLNTSFSLGQTTTPKAFRVGGDLDHNGRPDLVLLAQTGNWISYQNKMFCYKEASPATELSIRAVFPKGNENFFPHSVQFIEWLSAVPAGSNSTVKIELSTTGSGGPWTLIAENLPNNGKYQWVVPQNPTTNAFMKFTVSQGATSYSAVTPAAFTILGTVSSPAITQQAQALFLWPNPGMDKLFLRGEAPVKSFAMYDLLGNLIMKIHAPGQCIGTHALAKGSYSYQAVLYDGTVARGKWMKAAKD